LDTRTYCKHHLPWRRWWIKWSKMDVTTAKWLLLYLSLRRIYMQTLGCASMGYGTAICRTVECSWLVVTLIRWFRHFLLRKFISFADSEDACVCACRYVCTYTQGLRFFLSITFLKLPKIQIISSLFASHASTCCNIFLP